MFREMRRKKQLLSMEETEAIMMKGTSGVLALAKGDEGYPYAVPVSYVYTDGKIYFHCAKAGHKLDAIRQEEKVSFCVIEEDQIVAEEFTTYFKSVIAFGRARILEEPAEIRQAIVTLADKYSGNMPVERRDQEINGSQGKFVMVEITIDHMTGKQAIEWVK